MKKLVFLVSKIVCCTPATSRRTHQRCSIRKVFLWQESNCSRASYLTNLQSSGQQLYLKKRLWHRPFLVNFAKFTRTPFFIEHLRWLLLNFATPFVIEHLRWLLLNFATLFFIEHLRWLLLNFAKTVIVQGNFFKAFD